MKTITLDSRPVFQGDIRIRAARSVPAGYALDTSLTAGVVAHSETGHNHVLDGADVRFYRKDGDGMTLFAEARSTAVLKHLRDFDTHEPFEFVGGSVDAPVVIEFRRQREHTPEGWRRVED